MSELHYGCNECGGIHPVGYKCTATPNPSSLAPASGSEKWRLLQPGEMRQLGDQIKAPMLGWIPVCEADIGKHQTDGFYLLPVRRLVSLNTQAEP